MKDPIREYFKSKRANFEPVRHPYYNNSLLTKIGHKYLYFAIKSDSGKFFVKKIDMNSFFNSFCR